MKKYVLFLIIAFIVLAVIFAPNVQAGKPRPTEYPPPDTEFEAQAYPPPSIFPPSDDLPLGPYFHGIYFIDYWSVYVSKYTGTPDTDDTIWVCISDANPDIMQCWHHSLYTNSLEYIGFDNGRSWYRSRQAAPIQLCGWVAGRPDASFWEGESFTFHQPPLYFIPCPVWENPIYLPFTPR